jgi:SAM-dependent methyltransferase
MMMPGNSRERSHAYRAGGGRAPTNESMSIDSGNLIEPSASVACVACDSHELTRWGRLPVYTVDFLGSDLDPNVDPGTLYECKNCTLRFRAPRPTDEQLRAYYQGMDVTQCWQHGPEREVWRYIKQALDHIPEASVLDVGCFRGDMLSYLGNGFERFGVEPSKEAALAAQRRGVNVLAESIESMCGSERRFGAITLIDVAEHLPRPLDSLRLLSRLLLPGGRLIIFTGSTDALSWRVSGLDYYYSAMPEHVVFMRPAWFRWAASKIGCDLVSIRRMRYQSTSWLNQLDEGLKNLFYLGYHRLQRWPFMPKILLKLPIAKRIGKWPGCWWTSAKDHTLIIMTKIAS